MNWYNPQQCTSELWQLNQCFDDIQLMEQIVSRIVCDQLNQNLSFQHCVVDAINATGFGWLPLQGGTLTGPLTLNANAAAPLQAVPLQQLETYLSLSGGILTGPLTLAANATLPLQATTLQQLQTYLPLSGGNLTGSLVVGGSLGVGTAPNQNTFAFFPGAGATSPISVTQTGTGAIQIGSAAVLPSYQLLGVGMPITTTGVTVGTTPQNILNILPGTATTNPITMLGSGTGGIILQNAVQPLGFFNSLPVTKRTVAGSRTDGTALASLLTGLAQLGLLTDNSVA